MPVDFDSAAWDQLGGHLGKRANDPAFGGWANAHNAIAYRFRGAAVAEEQFTKTFAFAGDRCAQEEALFAFFFNAVASVECSLYGLFHIGAMADPSAFPIASDQALRRIDRAAVKKCFQATFSAAALTAEVVALVDDPVFTQLRDYRDTLAHRGAIPRHHRVSLREPSHARIPSDIDAVFMSSKPKAVDGGDELLELDATVINPRRTWLAAHVGRLLRETAAFCVAHLP
jgi:hypothetical protein